MSLTQEQLVTMYRNITVIIGEVSRRGLRAEPILIEPCSSLWSWLAECFAGTYDDVAMASGMFHGDVRRSLATPVTIDIFKPKRGFVFCASRGYTADVTSATVNTSVVFSQENGLQNRFSPAFSRGLLFMAGLTFLPTVVKTEFVTA